jgi:aconitase B
MVCRTEGDPRRSRGQWRQSRSAAIRFCQSRIGIRSSAPSAAAIVLWLLRSRTSGMPVDIRTGRIVAGPWIAESLIALGSP